MENKENGQVFISYSWTSKEHEQWVIDLATRLMGNGVPVILDKWELKEGQSVYHFMESMVNLDSISRVLVICDKGYKEKADKYQGGAGTEMQIITPAIYENTNQEKFIPIVSERDETGKMPIPILFKSRKYIDMSSVELYEDGFESLIRNLYNKPKYRKPPLGETLVWRDNSIEEQDETIIEIESVSDFEESGRKSTFKYPSETYDQTKERAIAFFHYLVQDAFEMKATEFIGDFVLGSLPYYTDGVADEIEMIVKGYDAIGKSTIEVLELVESNCHNPFHSFILKQKESKIWKCYINTMWSEDDDEVNGYIQRIRDVAIGCGKANYQKNYIRPRVLDYAFQTDESGK